MGIKNYLKDKKLFKKKFNVKMSYKDAVLHYVANEIEKLISSYTKIYERACILCDNLKVHYKASDEEAIKMKELVYEIFNVSVENADKNVILDRLIVEKQEIKSEDMKSEI